MKTNPIISSIYSTKRPPLASCIGGVALLIIAIMTIGCSGDKGHPANPTEDNRANTDTSGHVDNQTITLKDEDVFATKPELYQPSYNLYGQLAPVVKKQILATDNALISDVLVNNGDWVDSGHPLLRLQLTNNDPNTEALGNNATEVNHDREASLELSKPSKSTPSKPSNLQVSHSNSNIDSPDIDSLANSVDVDNADVQNTDTITSNNTHNKTDQSYASQVITITAPSAGEVTDVLITPNSKVTKNQLLLTLTDTTHLQLIGELPLLTEAPNSNDEPIATESQLSIGQAVNFTVYDVHQQFAGQISRIAPNATGDRLTVHALVNRSEDTKAKLHKGMQARMSVNYGQTQVGILLPARGIHDVDLSELNKTHTRPVMPLHGYVWVIGQDQRLSRAPVNVVAYVADTDQYLVVGISNDSLVSLADLPASQEGKLVKID